MKLLTTIFIFVLLVGCSQNNESVNNNYENRIIDSLIQAIDSLQNTEALKFQTAQNLEGTYRDSSQLIYNDIATHSNNKFWIRQSKSRLSFFEAEKAKKEFIEKIEGIWKWRSTFTNWMELESPATCDCRQKILITNGRNIKFYRDDKLIRETEIEIISKPNWGGGHLTENIYFVDNKELRTIYFNDKTNTLTFIEPDCECGCLTDEYSRH